MVGAKLLVFCIVKHVNNLTFSRSLLSWWMYHLWLEWGKRRREMTMTVNEWRNKKMKRFISFWNQCKFQSFRFMHYFAFLHNIIDTHNFRLIPSFCSQFYEYVNLPYFRPWRRTKVSFTRNPNQRHYLCEQHTKQFPIKVSTNPEKNNYIFVANIAGAVGTKDKCINKTFKFSICIQFEQKKRILTFKQRAELF